MRRARSGPGAKDALPFIGRARLLTAGLLVPALWVWSACGSESMRNRDGAGVGGDGAVDETARTDGAGVDGGEQGSLDAPVQHGYALPEFVGGFSFYIRLPPKFSPFLPLSGDEATREPPGFYDPTADFYFSYELIWWLNGTPDLSTTALRDNLRDYYVGLCGNANVAVTLAEPAALAAETTDAAAKPGALVARRSGTLTVGSCFGNPVPPATLEVSTYDCPEHPTVLVVVSPQPVGSEVWTQLLALRDGLTCW